MAGDGITFVHNSMSPDVYADRCTGVHFALGNIRLTFEVARVNHETSPGPVERVVVGRLVMPLSEAESMAHLILRQVEALQNGQQEQAKSLN